MGRTKEQNLHVRLLVYKAWYLQLDLLSQLQQLSHESCISLQWQRIAPQLHKNSTDVPAE